MNRFESVTQRLMWVISLLLAVFLMGCGGKSSNPILGGVDVNIVAPPPTVTFTTPANGDIGVTINRKIVATFSEPMDPATITSTTFKVMGATAVTGTVTYSGLTAIFTASGNLATQRLYTATISTGVKNLAGIAMQANHVWRFTTGLTADTTAPILVSTGAADGATGLPINRVVTATFSEPMDPKTLASPSTSFTVKEFVSGIPVVGVVSYIGNTATFHPSSNLLPNTKYTSRISTAATDLAGNALMAGLLANPWSWTTGATTVTGAPTVTITSPVDLATGVFVDTKINVTFSEAMNPSTMTTANVLLKETLSGNSVPGTVSYDVQHNIATFFPQANLATDTGYTVKVNSGALSLEGIALVVPAVGLPNNPWTFRTAFASAPRVPLAINLRGIATFGIASRAGMTSTGVTVVNGDVALYPLPSCTDSTGNAGASQTCLVKTYSSPTGLTVNGSIYFFGDPFDNGGTANAATNDLQIAWNEAFSKVDTHAGVLVGELGGIGPVGKIIFPGVYNEANLGLAAGWVATLDAQNDANAIFIFKVGTVGGAGDFVDSGTLLLPTTIRLINGAQARNVWFVAGRDITIGSGSTWNGNILAGRTATILDGSTVNGRVLAGAAGAGAITLTGAAAPSVTTITVPQ